jgi:hypothetical protein
MSLVFVANARDCRFRTSALSDTAPKLLMMRFRSNHHYHSRISTLLQYTHHLSPQSTLDISTVNKAEAGLLALPRHPSPLRRTQTRRQHGRRRPDLPPDGVALLEVHCDDWYVSPCPFYLFISRNSRRSPNPPSPHSPIASIMYTNQLPPQSAATKSSAPYNTSPASSRGTSTARTAPRPPSRPLKPRKSSSAPRANGCASASLSSISAPRPSRAMRRAWTPC